ncbi:MAG: hypothetical protein KGO85_11275 [Proteobacteria bacterium]|nr:hypothetical protein [Pseudomonadota bacterium]
MMYPFVAELWLAVARPWRIIRMAVPEGQRQVFQVLAILKSALIMLNERVDRCAPMRL